MGIVLLLISLGITLDYMEIIIDPSGLSLLFLLSLW